MAGNGRPIIPGQMAVETTFAQGPLAQPAVVTLPSPGMLKILTIGGLSKVEALAGQDAARLMDGKHLEYSGFGSKEDQEYLARVAVQSVDAAEVILAECTRRVVTAQEYQAKPQIEGDLN